MPKNASTYRQERDTLQGLLDTANNAIGQRDQELALVTADRDLLDVNYTQLQEAFGFLKAERDTLAETVSQINKQREQANAPRSSYVPPPMVKVQVGDVVYEADSNMATGFLQVGDQFAARVHLRRTATGNLGVLNLVGRSVLSIDPKSKEANLPEKQATDFIKNLKVVQELPV